MYILILFAYANIAMAKGDSVAFTNITFVNQKACIAAGEQAIKMANSLADGKIMKYVCVSAN